ncbi:hypothetical protein JYU34_014001 [Plutella xylostella]|uniref:Uncharacterized protein n=1 Tax=Plutella xylostella TaxID=51655 RepID=A0ABQ7Q7D6_PLUXY|nr:hypothetical protein JYU34_014001 [Plutella xylostella]
MHQSHTGSTPRRWWIWLLSVYKTRYIKEKAAVSRPDISAEALKLPSRGLWNFGGVLDS